MSDKPIASTENMDIDGRAAPLANSVQPPATTTGATAFKPASAGPSTEVAAEKPGFKRMCWEGADRDALYTLLLCGSSRKITADDKKKLAAKFGCTVKAVNEKLVKLRDTQRQWLHQDEIWRREYEQKPVHSRAERRKMAKEAKARAAAGVTIDGTANPGLAANGREKSEGERIDLDGKEEVNELASSIDGERMVVDGGVEE